MLSGVLFILLSSLPPALFFSSSLFFPFNLSTLSFLPPRFCSLCFSFYSSPFSFSFPKVYEHLDNLLIHCGWRKTRETERETDWERERERKRERKREREGKTDRRNDRGRDGEVWTSAWHMNSFNQRKFVAVGEFLIPIHQTERVRTEGCGTKCWWMQGRNKESVSLICSSSI